jgi:hypothetical protein
MLEDWSCKILSTLFTEKGNKKVIIGGEFIGLIKKIKIFSYPKIKSEAMLNMRLSSKMNLT